MLDHVSIVVGDFQRAVRFYSAVLAALDIPCVWQEQSAAGYGLRNSADDDGHTYLTIRSLDVRSSLVDVPGRHWCFRAPSRAAVDVFHAVGLANGGNSDGPPGVRPTYHEHYYAAFLRDPDGNRIEAVCHRTPAV